MFEWFANYLKKENNIGQIIADARRGGNNQLLKTLDYCKEPEGPLEKESQTQIKDRVNAICFAEKNFLSGGLEITDLISFICFFHAGRKMSSMKEILFPTVWKQIKKQLTGGKMELLRKQEIRKFFNVKTDGVYKCLKRKKP